MSNLSQSFIWIDLEMTGLNIDSDEIIEIATVVTDAMLNIIAEGPALAIYQPDSILEKMDTWNKTQHQRSGLIKKVKESRITIEEAEQKTLAFLAPLVSAGSSPMCGNSICQDRRFLYRQMPALEKYFHYRNLDVSTIKILAKSWAPSLPEYRKVSSHLALDDIYDSITELKYYQKRFFNQP